jgi:hypothetical protein
MIDQDGKPIEGAGVQLAWNDATGGDFKTVRVE